MNTGNAVKDVIKDMQAVTLVFPSVCVGHYVCQQLKHLQKGRPENECLLVLCTCSADLEFNLPPKIIDSLALMKIENEAAGNPTTVGIKVNIGTHNIFCVDGTTKGNSNPPIWQVQNDTIQALSLYQLNLSSVTLRDLAPCVRCSCLQLDTEPHAEFVKTLHNNFQSGTFNVSAFAIYGYRAVSTNIQFQRCASLPNVYMSFLVMSGIRESEIELAVNITTDTNQSHYQPYNVEFGECRN